MQIIDVDNYTNENKTESFKVAIYFRSSIQNINKWREILDLKKTNALSNLIYVYKSSLWS